MNASYYCDDGTFTSPDDTFPSPDDTFPSPLEPTSHLPHPTPSPNRHDSACHPSPHPRGQHPRPPPLPSLATPVRAPAAPCGVLCQTCRQPREPPRRCTGWRCGQRTCIRRLWCGCHLGGGGQVRGRVESQGQGQGDARHSPHLPALCQPENPKNPKTLKPLKPLKP